MHGQNKHYVDRLFANRLPVMFDTRKLTCCYLFPKGEGLHSYQHPHTPPRPIFPALRNSGAVV